MKTFRSFALLGATALVATGLAATPAMAQTTYNQQKSTQSSPTTSPPMASDGSTVPGTIPGATTTYQRADGTVIQQTQKNGSMKQQRADGTQKAAKTTATQPLTPANYVAYAQTADLFEVEAAKIAVQRAQNKEVREYAERVVADNSTSAARLANAARQAGVTPTTAVLTAKQQTKLRDLRSISDAAFDQQYINAQLESQERELRLHNAYARNGEQPALRSTSGELAPLARKHLTDARQISAQLGHEG
jgi:putative membrane protein